MRENASDEIACTADIPATAGSASARQNDGPILTVIVPIFNEASTIDVLLMRVCDTSISKQIIVVDDGSTDETSRRLEQWRERPDLTIMYHRHNCGKGASIRTAMQLANGRFTIVQDGDLETNPEEYERLLAPLLRGECDMVVGSRFAHDRAKHRINWSLHRYGVCFLNLIVRLLYGVRLTDEACCYKVLPTTALREMDLSCKRFEFCPEVVAKACCMKLRIIERPISYRPRTSRQGKKLRLWDGFEAAWTLWRWRNWVPPEGDKITPSCDSRAP